MCKPIADLRAALEALLSQAAGNWLLIESGESEAPLVAKLISSLEQEQWHQVSSGQKRPTSSQEQLTVFLRFHHEFRSSQQYVSAVVEQIWNEHELLQSELLQDGLEALPQLPPHLRDPRLPPGWRLQETMAAVSKLLPLDVEPLIIWCLFPVAVAAPDSYVSLLAELAPPRLLPPCTSAMVRELPDHRHRFAAAPGQQVQRLQSDLSFPTLLRSLELTMASSSHPESERLQALLHSLQTEARP